MPAWWPRCGSKRWRGCANADVGHAHTEIVVELGWVGRAYCASQHAHTHTVVGARCFAVGPISTAGALVAQDTHPVGVAVTLLTTRQGVTHAVVTGQWRGTEGTRHALHTAHTTGQ